jgi:RNA polymerase sigma factor (sigma-70 family)
MVALIRLSGDEQRGLCRQAQSGDAQALTVLIQSVERFIWKLALSYGRRNQIDPEDLAQTGTVAALTAVRYFDPDRLEAKFSTYACRAIVHAIARNARKEASTKRFQSADDEFPDARAGDTDGKADVFDQSNLRNMLERLSPEDRQAVELRYGIRDGVPRTLAATGSLIGCTAERVRQRISRAIQQMRKETIREGFNQLA